MTDGGEPLRAPSAPSRHGFRLPPTIGFVEIVSTAGLDVTAVYTASAGSGAPALSVNRTAGQPLLS